MTIKKLIKGGVLTVFGTLIGSIANYLYNTFSGRLLGPELYGSFTSLLSVLAIVSVPTFAIQTISAKFTSIYLAEGNFGKVKKLILSLHSRLWLIGLIVTIIIALISPLVNQYLRINNLTSILILSVSFLVAFLVPITRGALQGSQAFFALSLNTTLDAIFRLGIGLGLIYLGFSLNGAIGGVVFGFVLAYLISFLPLKKIFTSTSDSIDKKNILSYSIPTILVIFCLTALVNVDLIMAKHYLGPIEAGHYGALSTIAKIIFYFSGPIVSVMFPMIADLQTKGEKHYHLLITTFLSVFVASLVILVVFVLAPQLTINLLYGKEFLDIWPMLPAMGLVMLIYGLVNVMVIYFLSIGQMRFVPYLVVFTFGQIGVLLFIHNSISSFVTVMLVTEIALLISLLLIYLTEKWPIIVKSRLDNLKESI